MIWCVEDDASIRDIELYALQAAGFEAKGFDDGLSCWEALKTEQPDLIVLDVMLPAMAGIAILTNMKESSSLCKISSNLLLFYHKESGSCKRARFVIQWGIDILERRAKL